LRRLKSQKSKELKVKEKNINLRSNFNALTLNTQTWSLLKKKIKLLMILCKTEFRNTSINSTFFVRLILFIVFVHVIKVRKVRFIWLIAD
jgi:hypothetical protein